MHCQVPCDDVVVMPEIVEAKDRVDCFSQLQMLLCIFCCLGGVFHPAMQFFVFKISHHKNMPLIRAFLFRKLLQHYHLQQNLVKKSARILAFLQRKLFRSTGTMSAVLTCFFCWHQSGEGCSILAKLRL